MENKILFKNLTDLLNSVSYKNEKFIVFLDGSKFFKSVLKWLFNSRNNDYGYLSLNNKIISKYETFILDEIVPKLTLLDDSLAIRESQEINNFLTSFSVEHEDLLLKIMKSKFPIELLISFIDLNYYNDYYKEKISLNDESNIFQSIKDDQYEEVMNELHESDQYYEFLNYYNNSKLNNPIFKENKVFSHKNLVKKTSHTGEYEINYYFNKDTKELEFFIVENYDLTDLNNEIHTQIELKSIIEEFQKSI